jgi:hypothetical protein
MSKVIKRPNNFQSTWLTKPFGFDFQGNVSQSARFHY